MKLTTSKLHFKIRALGSEVIGMVEFSGTKPI
jgi:hypothetical protein